MLLPIPSPAPGVVINDDTSTASVRYPVFAAITNGQAVKEYVSSSKLYYTPSTGVLNATGFAGAGTGLTGTAASLSIGGNAATATLATAATNLAGGVVNNIAYQTGAGATAFITAPSISGSYLQWTSVGGFAWTAFNGVTSFSAASTGLTPNLATTGAITLGGTLSAAYGGTGANTLTGYVYGNGTGVMTAATTIPNTAISGLGTMSTQNASGVAITGGSINGTSIGGSVASTGAFTTLGGTTITASTQFSGPGTGLTGTASSLSIGGTAALATSLAAGSTYSIPYQSAAGTTAFLAAGTSGSILMTLGSFSAPIWTSAAALSVASANNLVGGNSGYVPYQSAASTTAFVSAGTTGQVFTSGGTGAPTWTAQSALSVGTATNVAGGAANQIHYQTGAGATSFITAPTVSSTFLQWNGSAFVWAAGGSGTVTSVAASGGTTGLSFTGSPITTSGTLTLTGTLAVTNGGTGYSTGIPTPQVTVYTSGSGTYTVPANCRYLYVKMVGGGGGGAGGNNGGNGTAGGNTTFGSSFLTAGGGGGGYIAANGIVGSGGTATIGSGATGIAIVGGQGTGGTGQSAATGGYQVSSAGGNSALGGGAGGQENQPGANGAPNTGAGGAGSAGTVGIANVGGGGGAGGYIEAYITTLAASYSVAIGAGGTGGAAGTSSYVGGNGGAGLIIVTAFF